MQWVDGALWIDPPAGQVLADTGTLAGGTYQFHVVASVRAEGAAELVFELRNAGNTATRKQKTLAVAFMDLDKRFRFAVESGERVRVTNRATLPAGAEVQVSIWFRSK